MDRWLVLKFIWAAFYGSFLGFTTSIVYDFKGLGFAVVFFILGLGILIFLTLLLDETRQGGPKWR